MENNRIKISILLCSTLYAPSSDVYSELTSTYITRHTTFSTIIKWKGNKRKTYSFFSEASRQQNEKALGEKGGGGGGGEK